MLKSIIVILLIGIVLSLIIGGVFFFKDQGRSKRTMVMLGIRVSMAVLLMACVTWGVMTGELTLDAPWLDRETAPAQVSPDEDPDENPDESPF